MIYFEKTKEVWKMKKHLRRQLSLLLSIILILEVSLPSFAVICPEEKSEETNECVLSSDYSQPVNITEDETENIVSFFSIIIKSLLTIFDFILGLYKNPYLGSLPEVSRLINMLKKWLSN